VELIARIACSHEVVHDRRAIAVGAAVRHCEACRPRRSQEPLHPGQPIGDWRVFVVLTNTAIWEKEVRLHVNDHESGVAACHRESAVTSARNARLSRPGSLRSSLGPRRHLSPALQVWSKCHLGHICLWQGRQTCKWLERALNACNCGDLAKVEPDLAVVTLPHLRL